MAYRFIEKHQRHFGTRWLLKRMGIFPNAYYNYLKQAKAAYHAKKSEICRKIKDIYHEFGGILGHRSMRVFLARNQIFLSKTTVHKYMNKELHLQCVCRRKRPGYKKGTCPQNLSKHVEPKLCGRQSKSGLVYRFYICFSYEWFYTLQLYHH